MSYTAAKDEPIDGCPRLSEEDFQRLKEAGEEVDKVRVKFKAIYEELLEKYAGPEIIDRHPEGTPKTIRTISGHNVLVASVIY